MISLILSAFIIFIIGFLILAALGALMDLNIGGWIYLLICVFILYVYIIR